MAKRALWSFVAGLALLAALPGILAFGHGHMSMFWPRQQVVLIAAALVPLGAMLVLRRTAWVASLGAVAGCGLVGTALMNVSVSGTHTWLGDVFMHGRTSHFIESGPNLFDKQLSMDLVYLKTGAEAAQRGEPLRAPEGGYLAPINVEDSFGTDTTLRFVSKPTTDRLAEQWNEQLRIEKRSRGDLRLIASSADPRHALSPAKIGLEWAAYVAVYAVALNLIGLWRKK